MPRIKYAAHDVSNDMFGFDFKYTEMRVYFFLTELNRLQNAIKRKIYHYRQQAWEDNLSTLNAEDNSLWGIAKAFRKKTSPISALNGPTGIALSDTNKTEVIAHSLEKQFHLNDIHNPRKDEIITSVVDAYMDSNINNTDIIPPLSHLKLFRSLKRLKSKSFRERWDH
ncbi:uncharacterized protein TNCV_1122601 [Trichonephila clavipes]|uniref:Uncharacterized protein n=1 Tax=Trichonephila clavipes TaxID=2585209 RepID=A0A8X6SKF9_TRICX|nr:uncharacterized protein TNCV_1122601 [Trichonephila clavipes]